MLKFEKQELHPKGCTPSVLDKKDPERVYVKADAKIATVRDLSFRDLLVQYYEKRRELLNFGYRLAQLCKI